MKLLVDENMPLAETLLRPYGDVVTVPGRSVDASQVKDADALFVRSVTQVNESLLKGSAVSFVGSATIGVDHLSQGYLQQAGITYCSAPGCNAQAVVEYVVAALLRLEAEGEVHLTAATVGIVGMGNVGRRLRDVLRSWGMTVWVCDPLLAEAGQDDESFVSLERALGADIVSVHTPLTHSGPHATHHLLGLDELHSLRHDAVLINAARGGIIDNAALKQVLAERGDLTVVLDVWEGEPRLDVELAHRVAIATPHIAGYSYDGKIRGTTMVVDRFLTYLSECHGRSVPASCVPEIQAHMPVPPCIEINKHSITTSPQDCRTLVEQVYPIMNDDMTLRAGLRRPHEDREAAFDQQRKHYGIRREFSQVTVRGGAEWCASLTPEQQSRMAGLDFILE